VPVLPRTKILFEYEAMSIADSPGPNFEATGNNKFGY
jgi:hypothetical protein